MTTPRWYHPFLIFGLMLVGLLISFWALMIIIAFCLDPDVVGWINLAIGIVAMVGGGTFIYYAVDIKRDVTKAIRERSNRKIEGLASSFSAPEGSTDE